VLGLAATCAAGHTGRVPYRLLVVNHLVDGRIQIVGGPMVREILRNEVQQLVADPEVQLVDVLPAREYEDAHLPGAIHLPLTELTRETAAKLRRDRPVIVYCHDAR
jgi:hypothetical protein